jgi:hypothetical protein
MFEPLWQHLQWVLASPAKWPPGHQLSETQGRNFLLEAGISYSTIVALATTVSR